MCTVFLPFLLVSHVYCIFAVSLGVTCVLSFSVSLGVTCVLSFAVSLGVTCVLSFCPFSWCHMCTVFLPFLLVSHVYCLFALSLGVTCTVCLLFLLVSHVYCLLALPLGVTCVLSFCPASWCHLCAVFLPFLLVSHVYCVLALSPGVTCVLCFFPSCRCESLVGFCFVIVALPGHLLYYTRLPYSRVGRINGVYIICRASKLSIFHTRCYFQGFSCYIRDMSLDVRKRTLGHYYPAKVQISMRHRAV